MKLLWLTAYIAGFLWLVMNLHDYFSWFLKAAPALIGLAALVFTS
jgi:apolipoprotein N-acyltransferase